MHVEDLTLPESSINAMCFERAKARRLVRLTMYELEHTLSLVARRARWGHISDEMTGKWVSNIPSRSSLPKSQKMITSTQHRPPGSFCEGVDEAGSPKRVAALEASLELDSRVLRVEVLPLGAGLPGIKVRGPCRGPSFRSSLSGACPQ